MNNPINLERNKGSALFEKKDTQQMRQIPYLEGKIHFTNRLRQFTTRDCRFTQTFLLSHIPTAHQRQLIG